MKRAFFLACLLAASPAVAKDKVFDCTVVPPMSLVVSDEQTKLVDIGFNEARGWKWAFKITMPEDSSKVVDAAIEWPTNPIQVAGKFKAIPIGEKASSIVTVSAGPCMFTETACTSVITLSERQDGTAQLSIQPAALSGRFEADTRKPFIVVIEGTCQRIGA